MKKIIVTILLIILVFFLFIFFSYKKISILDSDGYALANNEVSEYLLKENVKDKNTIITPVKVKAFDYLYAGQGKLFVGEEKKKVINADYPIFTNDNLAILNLSNSTTLIDSNFETYSGYPNLILTDGELYNKDDNEKADKNIYYFLKLPNSIMVNSKMIKVKTDTNTYTINMNSMINFSEDSIKYYGFKDDAFLLNKISDIDLNSKITINDKTYKYEQLLIKLKIMDEKTKVKEPEKIVEDIPKVEFKEPKVSITDFKSGVYVASSELSIDDSAGRITSSIVFELKKDGKVFLRKAYMASGVFEIVGLAPSSTFEVRGYYKYLDKDDKEVEKTFYESEIKTESIDKLTPLKISFISGAVFSSKIEIKNLKITDGLLSETIRGVKKISIKVNDNVYRMNITDFSKILNGEEINYLSPENVKSNSFVQYEITMTDGFGNELIVQNNKGETRTSKKEPTVSVKVLRNEITKVVLDVKESNIDDVNIENYRYVVAMSNNTIVESNFVPKDGIIELTNLNSDEMFVVNIFGDYDIQDGNGMLKEQLLGETKFTSVPITSLGYIKMNTSFQDITDSSANLNASINMNDTNNKLLVLLKNLKLTLKNKDNIAYTINISGSELEELKAGSVDKIEIKNLLSSTEYTLEIESTVSQGSKEYKQETLINNKSFITMKKEPIVIVKNTFITENLIDFDVSVIDLDNSILNNKVRLEVRDEANKIVRVENITTNSDDVRLTYDKLSANATYTFNYIAIEYNKGHTNADFEENKIIKKYTIYTETGINGNVVINNLLEKQLGKNLFNINNITKWKYNGTGADDKFIDKTNEVITLSALNGYKNNSYYLIDKASKKLTISFYAKRIEGSAPVYIANSDGDSTTYLLSNVTNEYKKYTYTFTLNANGYVGINIRETSGLNTKTTIMIKELQIEESAIATTYQSFINSDTYNGNLNINLNDTRDEITTNDYYIKVYKHDQEVGTYRYDIDNTNVVTNKSVNYDFEKNTTYKVNLVIKIREREYIINSTTFTTENEIRSIKTPTEFFRMHNNGKYIVISDLDFRNNANAFGSTFYGDLDFQGHKVTVAAQNGASYLIANIGTTGKVRNIDFHVYINNVTERSYYYGFNSQNFGTIENIMITIEATTINPNIYICTLSYINYGTVTNFVVNAKASIYGERAITAAIMHNYGTAKNGYIYGMPINATYSNQTSNTKRTGSLTGYTANNSIIKNVYSLIGVNTNTDGNVNNKQIGTIAGESGRGLIQNTYTVADTNIQNTSGDPSIGYVSAINSSNMFYVSNQIYNSQYSQKLSTIALHDIEFQNKVLNSDNQFIVDDMISNGYYPHVIWPDCMPYQELIPLVETQDSDLIDITSTEVVESNVNSAKVILSINNPSLETITNITIKDAAVRILDQEDFVGKSKVTVMVENPIKYVSKYYVKSITSAGAFGISYTRYYADNERALYFDLYRPINTLTDWNTIKQSPSENYQLTADLDFMYATNFLVGNFSGKLNGNGHTIKNIEVTTGNGLFTTLSGEIRNLFILNYKKTNAVAYGGLIYNSSGNAVVDNVHMTNVTINSTGFSGGIIGYGSGIIIKNSSVTNFKNSNAADMFDFRVGAIAGYLSSGYLQNTYVNNVNIDVTNSVSTYGIGGMVGQIDGGLIENCYVTGTIKTNSSNTGGIAGLSSATIDNVYTSVDIESSLDYIGGIVGQSSNNYISNSLVVGDLYSSYATLNMHRTVGNVAPGQSNYALSSQLINGYQNEFFYGDILISYNDLKKIDSYKTVIKMGDYYNYDGVVDGKLPKLYNIDGVTLLPNQTDNYLPTEKFSIISIDTAKRMNDATILISFGNPNNLEITSLEFDYLTVNNINKLITQNGVTTIELDVTPNKSLDSYKITKINYKENSVSKTINMSTKIDMQFYKNIGSFEDWQRIDSSVPENYRLIADIDFTGKVNINKNVVLARLEGVDDGYTIKNLTIDKNDVYQSLISNITTNLTKVNFDNIKITNNRTSGNYNNIIRVSYADITYVNFTNITIAAPKMSYSAPIGISRGYHITNINLDTINVSGLSYTAGLVGYAFANAYTDINGKNLTISGQNYTGGLFGFKNYSADTMSFRINVIDSNITSTGTYSGGVFGMGSSDNSSIKNSTVTGVTYVGGFSGYAYTLYTRYVDVINVKVYGSSTYIGGAYGIGQYYHYNLFVKDSTVTGTTANAHYVGGIFGNSGGYGLYNSGVINTTVTTLGNNAGGISGYQYDKSFYYSFVYNVTVSAVNNAGGVTGYVLQGNVAYVNVNANVTATGMNAGAVDGYIANAFSNNATYPCRIYYTLIQGGSVTAPINVGGLAGFSETTLYAGHYYNNIIETTLKTTNVLGSISVGIGNNISYTTPITNLLVYKDMQVNGVAISLIPNNGLVVANYVTRDQLKLQATYTNKSFSTSRYDFSKLVNEKYPLVKDSNGVLLGNQVEVSLPTIITGTSLMLRAFEFKELPKVSVYMVDVDKINVEFSDIYGKFSIESNNKMFGNTEITKRVYTYKYNYKDDITIKLNDDINSNTYKFKAEDLRRLISVYDGKYYYINENNILGNINTINGDFINLYLNKTIDNEGNVYNLSNMEKIEEVKELALIDTQPLYKFNYDKYTINTYYNYSEIIDDRNIVNVQEDQYIVKNGNLEVVNNSGSLDKTSLIVDKYGGNNYLTILNNDGNMINMKTSIKVPNDLLNTNIKYFTGNILDNTGYILVYYNNGNIYGFDYRTGNKILDKKSKDNISVLDYIKLKISYLGSEPLKDNKDYEITNEIEKSLDKNPINKVLNNEVKETKYIEKYNNSTKQFVLYNEAEILESSNPISENDKIISSISLIKFYNAKEGLLKNSKSINGIYILIGLLIAVFTGLYIYLKNIKLLKKNS